MANLKLTLLGFCLVISSAIAMNPICSLPKDTGLCKAYFPRFYFNSATQKCERFVYGGCFGNANRFDTVEKCKSLCLVDCTKGDRYSCRYIPYAKQWCGFKGISFLCPHLCGLCEKPKY